MPLTVVIRVGSAQARHASSVLAPYPSCNELTGNLFRPASLSPASGSELSWSNSKDCIPTGQRSPPVLPPTILKVLAGCLGVSDTDIGLIQTCRAAFKDVVWNHPDFTASNEEIMTYNKAALSRDTCEQWFL
jgi:hypothetical protein